jgi:hypothetical protein
VSGLLGLQCHSHAVIICLADFGTHCLNINMSMRKPCLLLVCPALTFPGLASPVVLGDQLYNMTTGRGVADQHTRSTWHGIVQEGDYVDMRVPV